MGIRIKEHIPNAVTCCNLISGCMATGAAFQGSYAWAFVLIIIGAVFDFFDGMTARLLGVSSPIGRELDSLADVVTFGVAPSAMLFRMFHNVVYPSFLLPFAPYMPYTAFLLAAFSALRLAKFNTDERQSHQFIGLPTPANTLFWASLIVGYRAFLVSPHFNAFFLFLLMLLSCYLMVSPVSMMALKFQNFSWRDNKIKYFFLITSAFMVFVLGISSFAPIVVWYVILSQLAFRFRPR